MKSLIKLLAIAWLMPGLALAQSASPVVQNGNHVLLTAPDATPSSVKVIVPNAAGAFEVWAGGSLRQKIDGAGKSIVGITTVTPAATPVEGTNDCKVRVCIVPTAAASAAIGLPSSPTAGEVHTIINTGPNAVRVKAYGTPGINGAAAGTYIPLATFQQADCVASSTTAWQCSLETVPTPAGP